MIPRRARRILRSRASISSARSSLAATAPELDVSAWFLHADAGYTFHGPLKARLSVEYDHASGDGSGRSFGRFDTLFGMRRADLAPAGIYAQIGRANISMPGVRLEMAPTSRLDGFVAYRAMWLAERTDAFSTTSVRNPSGRKQVSGACPLIFASFNMLSRLRIMAVSTARRALDLERSTLSCNLRPTHGEQGQRQRCIMDTGVMIAAIQVYRFSCNS